MEIEGVPNFGLKNSENNLNLSEEGKEALNDLQAHLEIQRVPEEKRQAIIDKFTNKINNQTNGDFLDAALLNAMKEAKEINNNEKSTKKENTCPKCGSLIGGNFCRNCRCNYFDSVEKQLTSETPLDIDNILSFENRIIVFKSDKILKLKIGGEIKSFKFLLPTKISNDRFISYMDGEVVICTKKEAKEYLIGKVFKEDEDSE